MKAIGIIDFQKTSGKVVLKKLSFPKFRGKVYYQWKAGERTELQNALDYKGFQEVACFSLLLTGNGCSGSCPLGF